MYCEPGVGEVTASGSRVSTTTGTRGAVEVVPFTDWVAPIVHSPSGTRSNTTLHAPSSSAVVVRTCPVDRVTVTAAPGVA